ncbi:hypothetical protein UMC2_37061 [[Clostridium] sordellii]|nr:hypothetical protein UMC2_37061 [[Clostridium] sordellii] [Paeniclostridium sordellii]
MQYYSIGVLYIIFGLVIYFSSSFLLKLVNDNGLRQKKIIKTIGIWYILLGITINFVYIKGYILSIISITIPLIIYIWYEEFKKK